MSVDFFIDTTIGRDVTIQIDYVIGGEEDVDVDVEGPFQDVIVDGPEGFTDTIPFQYERSKVFIVTYFTLDVREVKLERLEI